MKNLFVKILLIATLITIVGVVALLNVQATVLQTKQFYTWTPKYEVYQNDVLVFTEQ